MKDSTIRLIFSSLTNKQGRGLLARYQQILLRQQLKHSQANSPFYRQKFAESSFRLSDIHSPEDLPKLGFFTYPKELQADPFQFLAVPRQKILYAMSSSGTTGEPKVVFFTRNDWEVTVRTASNGLAMMGVTPQDVAQILFCTGNTAWMTGTVVQSALERVGSLVLPAGNSISVQSQLNAMQKYRTTILLGTPSYLHRLTEEAGRLCDLRTLDVRIIRLGAEPWSETMRSYLSSAWGAEVYDSYGMMELGAAGAGECKAHQGMHLSPYILVEVIDPITGAALQDGELGELVYTTLNREGSPLLRYRSGDLGRKLPDEQCPCREIPTSRISRIAGRSDDKLFLGSGENIYPAQLETALLGVKGLTDFQVLIEKDGFKDCLHIRAEAQPDSPEAEYLREEIRSNLFRHIPFLQHEISQSQTIAPLVIDFLEPGTILRESPVKVRRLKDFRSLS